MGEVGAASLRGVSMAMATERGNQPHQQRRATDDVVCSEPGGSAHEPGHEDALHAPARSLVSVYVVSMDLVAGRFRLTHRRQLDSLVDLVQRELDIEARDADAPVAHELFAPPHAA